jgi:hypothetical protein
VALHFGEGGGSATPLAGLGWPNHLIAEKKKKKKKMVRPPHTGQPSAKMGVVGHPLLSFFLFFYFFQFNYF